MSDRSSMLVVPLAPASDGNGLAMRAGLLLDAMAAAGPVDLVIAPVSGAAAPLDWAAARARCVVVVEPAADSVVAHLADSQLRELLARTAPLPARARAAPPTLAASVTVDDPPDVVVAMRSYLAPLGITLARRLRARRVVVDLDDDDERLLRELGEHDEADAYARLAGAWLPAADLVLAAAPSEAMALAARYGLPAVGTLPNAVRPPAMVPPAPGRERILFVGNQTYTPNVVAVRELVERVLPALQREVPGATADVVGPYDERLADLVGRAGVRLTGRVPEVGSYYAGADVVVAPLHEGAGTRIKVLEAFAHERPVVATPAAVAGLAVRDGVTVLLGDGPQALARHAAALLRDPVRARKLADEALVLVHDRYVLDVVAPLARQLIFGGGG